MDFFVYFNYRQFLCFYMMTNVNTVNFSYCALFFCCQNITGFYGFLKKIVYVTLFDFRQYTKNMPDMCIKSIKAKKKFG